MRFLEWIIVLFILIKSKMFILIWLWGLLIVVICFFVGFVGKFWCVIGFVFVGKFYSYVEVSILFFIDIDNIVIYFESFKIFIVYKIFVLMYLVLL